MEPQNSRTCVSATISASSSLSVCYFLDLEICFTCLCCILVARAEHMVHRWEVLSGGAAQNDLCYFGGKVVFALFVDDVTSRPG